MPATPTAAEFLSRKVNVPSEMLTRDWDRVQAATRERAFFMASVTEHEILDAYRDAVNQVAAGTINTARASEIVRERLRQMGYAPKPGTEGSIKDLRSWRRLRTTIDTNAALARGYAGYMRQSAAVSVYPAKRLVRQVIKKEPRNWPVIFRQAAAQLPPQGVNVADMSAHVMHPIWRRISRFQLPYPPYDFGSGMGDKSIRLDEAKRLGVATLPPPLPPDTGTEGPNPLTETPAEVPGIGTVFPSMNEGLSASPEIKTPEVRDSLAAQLKGTARWENDRFVYLDPNGTRPDSPEALAAIIGKKPYAGAPSYQFEAAAQYARDGADSFTPGSDALYDFARLVHRTTPWDIAPPLWSGRSFPDALERDMWLESLRDGRRPDAGFPWLACALDAAAALGQIDSAAVSVILTIRGSRRARDLRPSLLAAGGSELTPGIMLEPGTKYRIVGTNEKAGVLQVIVEEVAQ